MDVVEEEKKEKKVYTTFNKQLLKEVLGWQAESRKESDITKVLIDKIKELKITCNIDIDKKGNILVTKGSAELYPCIVSHMDDVHTHNANKKVFEHDNILFAFDGKNQIGIGGDDKVGMYICLQALLDYKAVKVVFFVEEEVGCLGSAEVDLQFFKDCKFIAQPDRKGNSDFINYTNGTEVCSAEFKEFVKPVMELYGYSFCYGTSTDIGKLTNRKVGISCFNISCGYFDAHSKTEIVNIDDVKNCYYLIRELIDSADKQYTFVKVEPNYSYHSSYKSKNEEDELSDTISLMYKEENPKAAHLFVAGVNKGIRFVVDLIKKLDADEVRLDPKVYTIYDQILDSIVFENDAKDTLADSAQTGMTFDDEKKECDCKAYTTFTYNHISGEYEYVCSKCNKVVEKEYTRNWDD